MKEFEDNSKKVDQIHKKIEEEEELAETGAQFKPKPRRGWGH